METSQIYNTPLKGGACIWYDSSKIDVDREIEKKDEPQTSWNTAETRKAINAAAPCIGWKSQSQTHRTKKSKTSIINRKKKKKLTQILVYEKQLCLEQMVENKEPKKGQQGYRTQDTKQASVSNSVMSIYT